MNANVNNSTNTNNVNNNTMNANNIEFVCSRCGSKHIVARPKGEEKLPQLVEKNDILFIKGGVTDLIISAEEEVRRAVARSLDKLPEELVAALKNAGAYDCLVDLSTTIEEEGNIKNPDKVMRWMVSQTLKLLYPKSGEDDMTKFLWRGGWSYAIKVMENELNRMAHMEANKDFKALEEHRMIWTDDVFLASMKTIIEELNEGYNNKYLTRRCKGRKYIKIHHRDFNHGLGVFTDEWHNFIGRFINFKNSFNLALNYKNRLEAFTKFRNEYNKMYWSCTSGKDAFDNAFRAAGAYYTLKDLVLYEGVRLTSEDVDQLEYLKEMFSARCGEGGTKVTSAGYKMLGYLKAVLKDNHFDFEETKRKWYQASEARRTARRNAERRPRN